MFIVCCCCKFLRRLFHNFFQVKINDPVPNFVYTIVYINHYYFLYCSLSVVYYILCKQVLKILCYVEFCTYVEVSIAELFFSTDNQLTLFYTGYLHVYELLALDPIQILPFCSDIFVVSPCVLLAMRHTNWNMYNLSGTE